MCGCIEQISLPICHSLTKAEVLWGVWIPPWALDVLHNCSYLQLDASFRAILPYVYLIPLGIKANESFPLAVVFWLVESFELYQVFEDPILSDQHQSVCVY
jgi:hypothetical protein